MIGNLDEARRVVVVLRKLSFAILLALCAILPVGADYNTILKNISFDYVIEIYNGVTEVNFVDRDGNLINENSEPVSLQVAGQEGYGYPQYGIRFRSNENGSYSLKIKLNPLKTTTDQSIKYDVQIQQRSPSAIKLTTTIENQSVEDLFEQSIVVSDTSMIEREYDVYYKVGVEDMNRFAGGTEFSSDVTVYIEN